MIVKNIYGTIIAIHNIWRMKYEYKGNTTGLYERTGV